jgi:hypothetical protein
MNLPSSKIVYQDRRLKEKDFRYPETRIAGVEEAPSSDQTVVDVVFPYDESQSRYRQEIGTPENLVLDSQVSRKKGTSTFIDALVLFAPATGAVTHEFRVSKISSEE